MITIFLSCFLILLVQDVQAQCQIRNQTAPLCLSSGATILPDTYPIQSVVISTDPFEEETSSLLMPSIFIVQIMEAYEFSASDMRSPQIIIPTNTNDYLNLIEMVRDKIAQKNVPKDDINKLIRHIVHANTEPYNWQQDYFEATIDPQSGSPLLQLSQGYSLNHPTRLDYGQSLSAFIKAAENCTLTQAKDIPSDLQSLDSQDSQTKGKGYGSGEYGGNMEGLPGGMCLYADNLSPNVADSFCGPSRSKQKRIESKLCEHLNT